MNSKAKAGLVRLAKVAVAAALSAAIGWLSGPDAIGVFGEQYAVVLTVVLIPALSGLEKAYFPKTS